MMPRQKVIVNLAPADIKKEGSSYDLPIALGILEASGQLVSEKLDEYLIMGELALDGQLRPITGALPIAIEARKRGFKGFILPKENASEAAIVDNLNVLGASSITEAIDHLTGTKQIEPLHYDTRDVFYDNLNGYEADFANVQGQENIKRALEIAAAGGGIWSTVQQTRAASQAQLTKLIRKRLDVLLSRGVTTVEIKSGYGLSVQEELKQLRAIQQVTLQHVSDVVPTCLAAHMKPRDYSGTAEEYLQMILTELVPQVEKEGLARRFDIFVEESAFTPEQAIPYLKALKERGFELTVHGDQFTVGGSSVAAECGARSVDHLEVTGTEEAELLAKSDTIPVVLPGATMGLGCAWGQARILLDYGCPLAIASDWNPGSAPQGNLIAQAGLLAAFEELSTAEVLAGITERAARALGLTDRGTLAPGMIADLLVFPTDDYREILYLQGSMMPSQVWKRGQPQL